jgi:1-acyl-sn-glycerol-3-phosphate acyltransferase
MSAVRIPSKPVLYLRSLIFWLGFTITTVIVGTAVIISYPLDADVRLRVARYWGTINLWLLKTICRLDYRIEGMEHIGSRNAIVFAKHQSTWETMLLHKIIPLGRWVFKRELMRVPFFGWALACTDPIAIDRSAGGAAVNQLVARGTEKLKKGKWINIFPEGTRTSPGKKTRYKMGAAALAANSGYPVLPIAHNAGEYWPRHSFIKWPGLIEVRVGPYIETAGRKPEEIMKEARTWIENAMDEISDPARWDR